MTVPAALVWTQTGPGRGGGGRALLRRRTGDRLVHVRRHVRRPAAGGRGARRVRDARHLLREQPTGRHLLDLLEPGAAELAAGGGHEIGGHTLTHVDLVTVPATEARRQICDDRAALVAMGFPVTSFAYPFGSTDAVGRADGLRLRLQPAPAAWATSARPATAAPRARPQSTIPPARPVGHQDEHLGAVRHHPGPARAVRHPGRERPGWLGAAGVPPHLHRVRGLLDRPGEVPQPSWSGWPDDPSTTQVRTVHQVDRRDHPAPATSHHAGRHPERDPERDPERHPVGRPACSSDGPGPGRRVTAPACQPGPAQRGRGPASPCAAAGR